MRASYRTPLTVAAVLLTLVVVGKYVWPTQYRVERIGATVIRVDMWNGTATMLDPDRGWTPIPDAAPAYRQGWKLVRDSTLVTDSSHRAASSPRP